MDLFSRGNVNVHVLVFENQVPVPSLNSELVTILFDNVSDLVPITPEGLFDSIRVGVSRWNWDHHDVIVEPHRPFHSRSGRGGGDGNISGGSLFVAALESTLCCYIATLLSFRTCSVMVVAIVIDVAVTCFGSRKEGGGEG